MLASRARAVARGPAARRARAHALEAGTKSSATDMVTDDRPRLRAVDRRGHPGSSGRTTRILGEEGPSVAGTSGLRWVVDPLDGATNYI